MSHTRNVADCLPTLTRQLDQIGLSKRIVNLLRRAGFIYVWQVAEMTEAPLLRDVDGLGRETLIAIKEQFRKLDIDLGMQLGPIKDQLPKPLF